MSNFGLNPSDGAAHLLQGNGIAAVVAALIAKAKRDNGGNSNSVNDSNGEHSNAAKDEGQGDNQQENTQ